MPGRRQQANRRRKGNNEMRRWGRSGKRQKFQLFTRHPKKVGTFLLLSVLFLPTVFRQSGVIRPAGFGCVRYWAVQSSDGARGRHVQPLVKWAVFLFTFVCFFFLFFFFCHCLGQLAAANSARPVPSARRIRIIRLAFLFVGSFS